MKLSHLKLDITPTEPVKMAGYNRTQLSQGIHSPIQLHVMLLDFGVEKVIHVVIDSICVSKEFTTQIRNILSQACDLSPYNIFVSAIHTHSAPDYFGLFFEGTTPNQEYIDQVLNLLKDNVEKLTWTKEVTVLYDVISIEHIYGNRNNPDLLFDDQFSVLFFMNGDQLEYIYSNIATHPTYFNGSNFNLSSDLLGVFRKELSEAYHCDVMISNGAAGDCSTRFTRQNYESIEEMGIEFIQQVQQKLNLKPLQLNFVKNDVIDHFFEIDHQKSPMTQQIKERLKTEKTRMSDFFLEKLHFKESWGKINQKVETMILDLDQLIIVFLPGDVCSQYGLELKAAVEKPLIVVGYANDYLNYFVPQADYGKYFETFISRFEVGQTDKIIEDIKLKLKED